MADEPTARTPNLPIGCAVAAVALTLVAMLAAALILRKAPAPAVDGSTPPASVR